MARKLSVSEKELQKILKVIEGKEAFDEMLEGFLNEMIEFYNSTQAYEGKPEFEGDEELKTDMAVDLGMAWIEKFDCLETLSSILKKKH